ncbi:HAD family hydrolase [Psychrobacillus lasiicapitis]|uniref:HAD family hydrolase n=1 Tax=Psychrobacillus lasiicapitis TaxID=1636719 RepID=A0A544THT8_9BACI|nr:HAD-IA family hydrolase [Psychrobacillus lasiicapitis]TQR17019.1 HAD family hydrolase [Psychrobacillus lasiicapitis]GGA25215.1 haloacid dehalogenase [Psychrobacillus lasiicapitis]
MIQAVLFDLDGTLLDRDASVKKFIDNQYERISNYVGHIPKKEYMNRFIELDCRGYVWKDKVYQQLVYEYKLEIDWEYLLQDYISEFKHHCVPFSNLHRMLKELKTNGFVLGMITNGFGQFQMDNIIALGIEKYFDVILVSETEGIKKPDPIIFERALERLNVAASQSVFIGDHPDNDVRASQSVGMKGIWKKDFQWDTFETDFVVEDLGELSKLIEQLNTR